MTSRIVCAALVAALAGCSPALQPLPSSAPVTASAAPGPVASPAADSVAALPHGDALPALPAAPRVDVALSSAEVIRQALDVFGDSAAPLVHEASPAAEVGMRDEVSPVWDIDVRSFEGQARVETWVRRFTGNARDAFGAQIQRGVPYAPMMRAKLRAGGIPEDMVYLALIESGFDTHAYSRAAAVGMWQFMASTARDVGMRVDWWVDERRDPVRATDAAVRFINDLRRQFGSLYLAAAAYNGGPGRVARGLSRYADDLEGTTGDSLFFALAEKDALRAETKDYVPKLIAAAMVAKTPARYGIRIDSAAPLAYDSVRVPGNTPLAAVARAARVPVKEVRTLNPHILRGMTPRGPPMLLRVPLGAAASFADSFAVLDDSQRTALRRVVSKKGETLVSIARREGRTWGLTSRTLAWYNPGLVTSKRTGALRVGQTVHIPIAAVVAAAHDVPDPKIERYPKRTGSTRTHVVRRGENLSRIARAYQTTVPALMTLNRLQKPLIRAGQELVVRGSVRPAVRKAAVKKAAVKKTEVKKAAVKKAAVKKTAVKKAAVKKAAVKKAVNGGASAKVVKPRVAPKTSATAKGARA